MRFVCLVALGVVACGGAAFSGTDEISVTGAGAGGEGGEPTFAGKSGSKPNGAGSTMIEPLGGEKNAADGEAGQWNSIGNGGDGGSGGDGGEGGSTRAGNAGTPSAAGAAGSVGVPDINECSSPSPAFGCDSLCGGGPDLSYCTVCNSETIGYTVLGSASNPTNQDRHCACPGFTMQLPVKSMTCAKFTVQPGAEVEFTGDNCNGERHKQCIVAIGLVENAGTNVSVFVTRPSQNAWIHKETASLLTEDNRVRACPLACP